MGSWETQPPPPSLWDQQPLCRSAAQGLLVALGDWPPQLLLSPQAQKHISDLYEDLRDGHNLISLLEVLSGDSLVRVPLPPPGPACPTWRPLPAFPPWGPLWPPTLLGIQLNPSCLLPGGSLASSLAAPPAQAAGHHSRGPGLGVAATLGPRLLWALPPSASGHSNLMLRFALVSLLLGL